MSEEEERRILKGELEKLKIYNQRHEDKFEEIRKNLDNQYITSAQILSKLNEIDHCLIGTEYNRDSNGGLVTIVTNNNERINKIERTQARREGFISILSGFIGAVVATVISWMAKKG